MSTSIIPNRTDITPKYSRENWLDKIAKKALLSQLKKINRGYLVIRDVDQRYCFGNLINPNGPVIQITVNNPRFYSAIVLGGSAAAGEAYFSSFWDCDDLTALIRLMLLNRGVIDDMDHRLSRIQAPVLRVLHWLNRNTHSGSQRNISAHYDLGNDFFKLFLDQNMMYSAAIYPRDNASLEEASIYKIDRICQKLQLNKNDHVLEIGTGWGGFALHAAKNYHCNVTTATISQEQFNLATQRVIEAGLEGQITVLLSDYRDLLGLYDKIVSIEMIEAVGHHYINTYFQKCSKLLKPDGVMLLQAITIADQQYLTALKDVDFIKRFIFPGCFIPSVTAIQNALTNHTDMRFYNLEDIGLHYAQTLRDWRLRFFENIKQVKDLGYKDDFVRLWEFYLCYCEGSFEERAISNVQLILVKPESKVNCPV